ncbi:MAG: aspartate kinase [Elusimicrobia bacterium RIFOXYC2_FULL_34_12]|nr:MAG: aspartate kinase [Elusimicrobia bacterium RIFOXYC2_FULL_34_12]OGS38522.1 MAG: aspartate kinase [Elusimicrobia bacterium RIFOXYD2_FULL_34_30]HAM38097.1 aspartate kinase [Elusimicrobiota bacterium]
MLDLVVMKFGGSSVANTEKIINVATRVTDKSKKYRVVVVVSAPGDMTDDLIDKAKSINESPDPREMDMLLATGEMQSIALLSMAIKSKGFNAISLTGPQAGIYADSVHTKAKIKKIRPKKIVTELQKGKIVIVAGFQGLNPNDDIATLGRGGSDLTAVALAAALKAKECEIYTDVNGVYTTDPRLIPEAKRLDKISYDEMLELAGVGSQVMMSRSIEVAKKYNVDIHVRSTFSDANGTIITKEVPKMEDVVVSGVAYDKNEAKLSVTDIPDKPGIAAKIFGALSKKNINVDMIIQSAAREKYNDISFTVSKNDLKNATSILKQISRTLNAGPVIYDENVAKISIVGIGMRSHSGVAAKMFKILANEGINIQMISTSEIKISCIISNKDTNRAVRILHKQFGLG